MTLNFLIENVIFLFLLASATLSQLKSRQDDEPK